MMATEQRRETLAIMEARRERHELRVHLAAQGLAHLSRAEKIAALKGALAELAEIGERINRGAQPPELYERLDAVAAVRDCLARFLGAYPPQILLEN